MSSLPAGEETLTNHIYKDDKQLHKWYGMAQTKLKQKINDNLNKRVINSCQAIDYAIKRLIQDNKSNDIWLTLFPNISIEKYRETIPKFAVSQRLITDAKHTLTNKVDKWAGVDVSATKKRPANFKKYWLISDNWWNRYKAEWIGDYFFYPLLQKELKRYIVQLTDKYAKISYGSYKCTCIKEVLYFSALNKILYTEISFNRARSQPLILDQSFEKSDCLQQFFRLTGNEHYMDWIIPPKNKRDKNRLRIRCYARKWTDEILKLKQQTYDIVMGKDDYLSISIQPKPQTQPVKIRKYSNSNSNNSNTNNSFDVGMRMESEMKLTPSFGSNDISYSESKEFDPFYLDATAHIVSVDTSPIGSVPKCINTQTVFGNNLRHINSTHLNTSQKPLLPSIYTAKPYRPNRRRYYNTTQNIDNNSINSFNISNNDTMPINLFYNSSTPNSFDDNYAPFF